MDLNNTLKEKKENNLKIKNLFSLPVKTKALGVIKTANKSIIKDLRDGLLVLPANFVIEVEGIQTEKIGENIVATGKIDSKLMIGFDFIVCDDEIKTLNKYLELGITPILPSKNHLNSILKEFNPMKNEGNSYLFEHHNKWSIIYALVRYLENYKFAFDNKNLVKSVLNI